MQTIYRITLCFFIFLFNSSIVLGQCIEDSHSPFENQGWLSCTEMTNPNTFRTPGHWVLYDLGYAYPVKSFYFWNHNVWGETGMGVKEVALDFSMDNVNWIPLDTFQIEKAPGSWKYTGVPGSSFDEVTAQYFLFTVLNTWDGLGSCAGLGEIKFELGEIVSDTEDLEISESFAISPNPTSDWIKLSLNKNIQTDAIYLYSSMGYKLASLDLNADNKSQLDVSGLENGIYFITVYSEDKIFTQSFVKME